MSTSLNVVRMAAVFCASLSRVAMVWRRRVIRTRSSRRSPGCAGDGACCGGGGGGVCDDWGGGGGGVCFDCDGGGGGDGGGGAASCALAAASTSSLVSRPSLPVPLIFD